MLHEVREVGFLAPFPDLCPKEFAAVGYWVACSGAKRLRRWEIWVSRSEIHLDSVPFASVYLWAVLFSTFTQLNRFIQPDQDLSVYFTTVWAEFVALKCVTNVS